MNRQLSFREYLAGAAVYVLFATAVPRLVHLMRWPTRLGPRGLLAYIAGDTLFQFGVRHYVQPHLKRFADERQRLTERLGREPTEAELADHFGYGASRKLRGGRATAA